MKIKNLLPTMLITVATFTAQGQTWTQSTSPSTNWSGIASSADGTKIVAVSWPGSSTPKGQIYISTNSGTAWAQASGALSPQFWSSVASSADGTKLVATTYNTGQIYISTNSGASWQLTSAPNKIWGCVASSTDGSILAAGVDSSGGGIYISTNSGATWGLSSAPTNDCLAVAMSASGAFQIAAFIYTHTVYTSTNFGQTWVSNSLPALGWRCAAMSADGNKILVASSFIGGAVYISTNTGAAWQKAGLPENDYTSIACSADGVRQVVVVKSAPKVGDIYTSTNSGSSWVSNSVPFSGWYAVCSSADGGRLFAGSIQSTPTPTLPIYNFQATLPPVLQSTRSSSNIVLSWLIPSTNYVLQQSSNLANWSVVTNVPTLNLTNLQNQVTLLRSAAISFYRLKTP